MYKNRAGIRKLKSTTLLQNDGGLLSGLQHNALASPAHFVVWGRYCSVVGWCSWVFWSLPCFCTFSGPSLLETKFFQKLFLPSFCLFVVSKPSFKYNSFHLRIYMIPHCRRTHSSLANGIASATHLRIWSGPYAGFWKGGLPGTACENHNHF